MIEEDDPFVVTRFSGSGDLRARDAAKTPVA
jgi:hypothetical protein